MDKNLRESEISMKFLFFTDSHIRGTTPKNRKDNFYDTLKSKFFEIKQLTEELDIDYVLHGGDWFDRPDISPSIVREFAIILRDMGKPIYTLAGNHDLFGHNPSTVNRTMLGILEGIGIIRLLQAGEEIVLEKDGVRVQLTGAPYIYDIDGENFRDYYIIKKRSDVDYAINMVHGMLLKTPFFEGIQYTLVDDIKDTEADITIAGHYHNGFGLVNHQSKFFANPGSIVRVANSLGELKRRPKVLIITLTDRIQIDEVELKSALPGDEVLDRTQLEISKDRLAKLNQFYSDVSKTSQFTRIDLEEIINEIAANSELNHEVRNEALRRISVARENLSRGDSE